MRLLCTIYPRTKKVKRIVRLIDDEMSDHTIKNEIRTLKQTDDDVMYASEHCSLCIVNVEEKSRQEITLYGG